MPGYLTSVQGEYYVLEEITAWTQRGSAEVGEQNPDS
jgi:hypothetical protein